MSKLTVIYDTQTQTITFDQSAVGPYYCDFVASLNRHGERVDIKGLSYGATISIDGSPVLEKSWPPPNVRYVSTDQDVLTVERLKEFPPDSVCHVDVWIKSRNGEFSNSVSFVVPRPEQPYPSWSWQNGQWTPPVPYPDDDGGYMWDEDSQNWVAISSPVNINTATESELTALSGVGTKLAQAIIDGRPWSDPAELATISGISGNMIQAWNVEA